MSNEQLINETIESLENFLPKVANACTSIANDLRTENESRAMENIKQFIDAIDWSIQAMNGIKALGYLNEVDTSEINGYLVEAQEGLSMNDMVLIADMFEYELQPQIENWIKQINQFKGA